MVVAVGMMAAIGRIDRFAAPEKLVAYLGLNPSVRQSGDGRAHHGRITKRGSSRARHLLVEAAWQTVRSPGPMRAFYERVRARREQLRGLLVDLLSPAVNDQSREQPAGAETAHNQREHNNSTSAQQEVGAGRDES